eukprot:CAMPEP_0204583614 /NCGR_PEP_ID=MMETSP0661-20131031/45877_1 /ASSEMBLY_ACC=CAM_ASM_000606 /TAXON_ID=109239 /ORGANISM="Alexandrium margalefi, Strain AMGDE01CS-322" /LENGTH=59 /DNA_ID=CAMNT_0051592987 /DNA_START=31 /DNA_END=208 /DNA_ORIENTATION=+
MPRHEGVEGLVVEALTLGLQGAGGAEGEGHGGGQDARLAAMAPAADRSRPGRVTGERVG